MSGAIRLDCIFFCGICLVVLKIDVGCLIKFHCFLLYGALGSAAKRSRLKFKNHLHI